MEGVRTFDECAKMHKYCFFVLNSVSEKANPPCFSVAKENRFPANRWPNKQLANPIEHFKCKNNSDHLLTKIIINTYVSPQRWRGIKHPRKHQFLAKLKYLCRQNAAGGRTCRKLWYVRPRPIALHHSFNNYTYMALSNIEKHYNKHPEDLRLQRRHGIVEFETTMHHLRRFLRPGDFLLDIGAGTGRYTSALMAEGYRVKAVELVRRNIDVFLKREPAADVVQGDARNLPSIPTASADFTLLLGPLYHLIGDEEKLKALLEAKRVTKPGGLIFVAYLMNEYSILSYCFDEERIGGLLERGVVDKNFHIQAQADELYDYVRLDDINRLNEMAGLQRVTIFSPDGASDYMRTRLNRMSEETFAHFIEYQKCISERQDLIGAGSHVVDVVRVE